jgi:hypothetical protein
MSEHGCTVRRLVVIECQHLEIGDPGSLSSLAGRPYPTIEMMAAAHYRAAVRFASLLSAYIDG